MANLKRDFNRFVYRNRNKGIPNLMLWIVLGSALVYLFEQFSGEGLLYGLLCFDARLILQGQVWRLFSYVFLSAFGYGNLIFVAVALFFYYNMGKTLEFAWGTLRLNLYYLCGVLLIDVAGLLGLLIHPQTSSFVSAGYLNLSLFMGVATMVPDQRVLLFFFIPIRMKWLAFVDLIFSVLPLLEVLFFHIPAYGFQLSMVFYALFPLVALLNYFIFFGGDVRNILPDWMKRKRRAAPKKQQPNGNWAKDYRGKNGEKPYRHKCTVCGRTDTQCPDLEFRYCSKCAGYFCYCIDHINQHTHVQ